MYQTDKIAILLATYNGEKYLSEQLDSLLEQTNKDWITYIHDDGSNDKTISIIDSYAKKYPEKFVKVEGRPTGGAKENFLYLFAEVEAPFYMCCDQDDIWLPIKIQRTIESMKAMESSQPLLVFTELHVVDEKLHTIADTLSNYQKLDCRNTSLNRMLIQNVVTGCTMMVNRELRNKMLEIKDINHVIMHDWWAAIIAAQFGKIVFLNKVTILYRQHNDNSVGAKKAGSIEYIFQRLHKMSSVKESLFNTRIQAKELEACFPLKTDEIVHEYAEAGRCGKLKRMRLYHKYEIKKTGFARKIGMWIWG